MSSTCDDRNSRDSKSGFTGLGVISRIILANAAAKRGQLHNKATEFRFDDLENFLTPFGGIRVDMFQQPDHLYRALPVPDLHRVI